MLLQSSDGQIRERNGPYARLGLGGNQLELAVDSLERSSYRQGPEIEVYIAPLKPERLTSPQPERERNGEQCT